MPQLFNLRVNSAINSDGPNGQPEHAPEPMPAPQEGGGTTAVAEPEPAPAASKAAPTTDKRPSPPKLDHLPPFKVLLHNDDKNDMEYVASALVQIGNMPLQQAVLVMLEAHHSGLALVCVAHRELAELKAEQFQSKGLVATIEPA